MDATTPLGCERCAGADPNAAWEATRAQSLGALVDESHFSLRLFACACGQSFLQIFTERVDWQGGEDAQWWAVVPLRPGEAEALRAQGDHLTPNAIEGLGRDRRILVRDYPTGAELSVTWQTGGLAIPPHD